MRVQGGQVDTGETLADRLNRLGTPKAATATPLGATRAGATPDQAKMARSPARMQAMTKQTTQQPPTPPAASLQTAQRQAQGMGGVNVQDQSAQVASTQALAGMSAMAQQRVQAAINQRLNAVSQQQQGQAQTLSTDALRQALGITGQGLAEVSLGEGQAPITQNEAVTQFEQKLQEYAQNPSQDKLVELETLRRAAGFQGDLTSTQGINNLFMQAGAATGATAAGAVQDKLNVKDFSPEELGFESFDKLAETLGIGDPAALQEMSVEELQRQTQLAVDREQQHVEDLRAKLTSSPPGSAQRMIYERRLNNVLAGGAGQVELKAAEAAEDISVADKVKIGDQEMSVADVLDDAKMSSRIEAYLYSSPAQRDRLFPPEQFKDLREWIDANELALNDLSATLAEEQEGWKTSLDAWRNLGDLKRLGASEGIDINLPADLISAIAGNAYDPDKLVTQAQVDAVSQAIKESPVGELMKDPANADKIEALDPEDLAKLKGPNGTWNDTDTVLKQYEAGQALNSNEDYQRFAGAKDHDGDYATTDDLTKHAQAAPIFDQVQKQNPTWLKDDDFMDASLETKKLFADNPQRFKEFNELRSLQKAIEGPARQDANSLSRAMFGTDLASMEVMFGNLQRQSGFNRAAAGQLEMFKKVFGGDGNPVNGFWNVAGKLTAAADGQSIDTAAKGEAAAVLAQINEIKNAKFNARPQPYSIYGTKDAAGIPVSGIETNPRMRMDALYDIAERITGNQPMNMNHFVDMVNAVRDHLQLPPDQVHRAIAIVNDEFVYANKATATQDQIKEGQAPENFPAEYEHAKRMYDHYQNAGARERKVQDDNRARQAQVEAEKRSQAQAAETSRQREQLSKDTKNKAVELRKNAQQFTAAGSKYLSGTIPTNADERSRAITSMQNASNAQQQTIVYLEKQFKDNPWLRDNSDFMDELKNAQRQKAQLDKRVNEFKAVKR